MAGETMMKAMVLDRCAPIETRPLKLKSIPVPQPKKRGDVLLEIEACGVCRSNLHMIEGDWKDEGSPSVLPVVPGHEVVGVVKKAGSSKKLREGDRVGIQPLFSSCLKCGYCHSGKEHLCDDAEITGESVQGGYAEYIVANEDFVTPIPDSIDSAHAAPLFCPGITAYKAVKASEPAKGRSVGIFGVGGVGHIAVQIAKMEGARVVGISRAKKHLDLAKKLGADSTLAYQESTDQFIKSLEREEGLLDSAIVFAPSEKAIDAAIKSVKKGGLVVVGVVGEIPHFSAFEEKTIRGTVIGSRQDMADLVALAAANKSLEVVIETHRLAEANDVLARLKHSEVEARAVLVPR
ncbi:MAG: alcohol dehydrogenase catalytic domain-containing protein [Nitrososphaera sp.]|jgi:propanol-preferring alcohol dehydrogenase